MTEADRRFLVIGVASILADENGYSCRYCAARVILADNGRDAWFGAVVLDAISRTRHECLGVLVHDAVAQTGEGDDAY